MFGILEWWVGSYIRVYFVVWCVCVCVCVCLCMCFGLFDYVGNYPKGKKTKEKEWYSSFYDIGL